jgi:flagellar basal body-associated protein FliL
MRDDFEPIPVDPDNKRKIVLVIVAIGVIAIMFIVGAGTIKRMILDSNKPAVTATATRM